MSSEKRKKILDRDFTEFEFTSADLKNLQIPTRGIMRLGMGLAYSAKEWKKKRDRILNTPLP
jgi:hypothetical protein